ncbi:MAG: exo-alpha-sialidase, partial [Thermoplasmata archaeon]|nr:exo-alpha-sialidase [Thermoplasmata archaeon]
MSGKNRGSNLMIVLMLLMAPAFSMVMVGSSELTFRSNIPVVSDGYRQNSFDIAATGEGASSKIYVAYEDEVTNNAPSIKFKKSSNGGESFGPFIDFVNLNPPWQFNNKQRDPAIATHGNNIAVVYTDNTMREIEGSTADSLITCSISTDGGGLFNHYQVTPATLSDYPENSLQFPEVCYDPDGNIFVVWKEKRNSDPGERIFISYSTNNGSTWSTPQKV